ncbi:MAG: hypothetical protein D3922_07975 [Candidatus Electrothrix sp. AR1]|nr:hypothetical protein [Candidatus Electrothrix sp. AR1]
MKGIYRDYAEKEIKEEDITLDHDTPVVLHWIKIGYDSPRSVRNDWYNDTNNLTVMHKSENSSKGAKEGEKYQFSIKSPGKNYSQ